MNLSEMDVGIVLCEVKVTVRIGEHEHVLGVGSWMHDGDEDPEVYATLILTAWDKAHNDAEKTMRLYGAEGMTRALLNKVEEG